MKPLTNEQKNIIGELFKDLEVTHDHMVQSCSMSTMLSCSLNSKQLIMLLKVNVRLMVQINVMPGFLKKPITSQREAELLDDRNTRIKLMMTLDPKSKHLTNEKPNSTTHLLAATFAFKILKKFANGTTQREMQEIYIIRPKQLAVCITG